MKAQKQSSTEQVQERSTVVGVFEDRAQADRAVAELRKAGFRDDQIGVAMRHNTDDFAIDVEEEEGSEAAAGATAGALTGLGLGALAGVGVLAGVIPVIGPAIAGGTLGIILSNAAAGAGIAGLVGALVGAGIPEDEATYYQGEFEAGRVVVTVHADGRAAEAQTILNRQGAYNMHTQGNLTASSSRPAMAMGMQSRTDRLGDTDEYRGADFGDTIQVKEEQLHASKRPVEKGEVRVRKEVHTETKTLEVPVEREEVVIERRAVNKNASNADFRDDNQQIRIPVREEMVEVTKTPVVTEEVSVGKRTVRDTEKVSGQVRKEQVKIEREGDVEVRSRETGRGKK